MDETKLNTLLLERFPELTGQFEEYTSWQDGIETGCFLTFEDLLLPLARQALNAHDKDFLARMGDFIEELMTSDDEHAVNVATVGLIEGLKAYGNPLIRSFLGPVSLEEFDTMAYVRPCASKERRGGFRIGGAEACGMESGVGAETLRAWDATRRRLLDSRGDWRRRRCGDGDGFPSRGAAA